VIRVTNEFTIMLIFKKILT